MYINIHTTSYASEVVLEEQNLRCSSLSQSWIFWNWFSNLINFESTNDPPVPGKGGMGKEG